LQDTAVGYVGIEVGNGLCRTGIKTGAAIEVHDDVSQGTCRRCAADGTLPGEPSSRTVCAVVIIGSLSHLEAKELGTRRVLQLQQTAFKCPATEQVALVVLHGIDVPRVRRGRAAIPVLESTGPIGTVHAVFIDDEHLEALVGVARSRHLTGQDRHVIGILRQGQPHFRLDELVTGGKAARRNACQANGPIRTVPQGGRGLTRRHAVRSTADYMKGQGLRQGAGIHQGQ